MNDIESTSKGTFDIGVGLNVFLFSGLIIYLFVFSYNRLFNKDKIEDKIEKLDKNS